jgi:membrane protease YdiL (CAAX protease family)
MNKVIINFSLIVLYFLVAWFYPWGNIQIESTISVSYIWDLLFVVAIGIYLKELPKLRVDKLILIRLPIVALLATLSIYIVHSLKFPAPFKYIENIVLQILILAPLVEELIFRQAIFGLLAKLNFNEKLKIAIGSFLFSLSHAHALRFLPTEFHDFIYIQLIYTFVLGWIVTRARIKSQSILEPIILHFVFNLIFYLAVLKEWI